MYSKIVLMFSITCISTLLFSCKNKKVVAVEATPTIIPVEISGDTIARLQKDVNPKPVEVATKKDIKPVVAEKDTLPAFQETTKNPPVKESVMKPEPMRVVKKTTSRVRVSMKTKPKIIMKAAIKPEPMLFPMSEVMAPPVKPVPKTYASGLYPAGSPKELKKFMRYRKYKVESCFKKALNQGRMGSSKYTVVVHCIAQNGKLKITGVTGDAASVGSFRNCVKRIGGNFGEATFSKSWAFTMHLIP